MEAGYGRTPRTCTSKCQTSSPRAAFCGRRHLKDGAGATSHLGRVRPPSAKRTCFHALRDTGRPEDRPAPMGGRGHRGGSVARRVELSLARRARGSGAGACALFAAGAGRRRARLLGVLALSASPMCSLRRHVGTVVVSGARVRRVRAFHRARRGGSSASVVVACRYIRSALGPTPP